MLQRLYTFQNHVSDVQTILDSFSNVLLRVHAVIVIALCTGAFWSRSVYLGLVKPLIDANVETIENFTRNLTRLVLGIQLVIVGVQLPGKYLLLEGKSLAMLLGKGVCGNLLIFADLTRFRPSDDLYVDYE